MFPTIEFSGVERTYYGELAGFASTNGETSTSVTLLNFIGLVRSQLTTALHSIFSLN